MMSERVREYFPEVSEECVNCPGLMAAAYRMDVLFKAVGDDLNSDEILGPDMSNEVTNEDLSANSRQQSSIRVSNIIMHRTWITEIGTMMYQHCENGPVIAPTVEVGKFLSKKVNKEMCGSIHPVAAFIPLPLTQLPLTQIGDSKISVFPFNVT